MSATIVNTTDVTSKQMFLMLKHLYLLTSGQVGVRLVKPLHLFLKIYQVNML